MKLFSPYEAKILEKFRKPRIVSDSDRSVIDRYSVYGFFNTSFNCDTMEEAIKLTKLGIYHIDM